MKKTGLEIVEMIAKGEAPKKIYLICDEAEWELVDGIHYCYRKAADDIYDLDIMEHLNDEFEIIEESKVWKPKKDEKYYFIDEYNEIEWRQWGGSQLDDFRYELGNCFKTKEEAQKALEKIKIYVKLKRYALEHNEENIDWNNGKQDKWYIYFDVLENKEKISNLQLGILFYQVYFTSKELCGQAIKEIGEDNIKKLFEE